jgi:hypothetical protein
MNRPPSAFGALASRARLTEGQLYSSVITLALAGLLATGLGGIHGVVSSALSTAPLAPLPPAALPPDAVSSAAPVVPAPRPQPAAEAPSPYDAFADPLPQPAPYPEPELSAQPSSSPSPTPAPCTAQPVDDAGTQAILMADAAAGGGLPDQEMLAALHLVTGCSPSSSPSPAPLPLPPACAAPGAFLAADCESRR